ncbi:hypothetical protein DUNSADRAFT_5254 [Dunaliella salina]|uniref:Mitochondrial mRNA-processing protein COX24 C-terminal domain-containing protein n=1 Tax=Dunaliella salina TaxID=3046 RepID=A0ABQ7GQP1_DUNSA|nr:hypothetical protein DUNSADRAFT_5254 [Dunaliella salina]|eukprot:KAF5836923.1 hypothetical protein DUNSADRAFT_5254 [Dunaliella salina]
MLPRIFRASSGAADSLLGGVLRSALAAPSTCSSSHIGAATQAWSQLNPLPFQGRSPQCPGAQTMSTAVSPTQKQRQLFAEMQSVRRMLLLQDPNFWHTEPYFWAHGAHLLPTGERSRHSNFTLSHGLWSPTDDELVDIIEAQASNATQQFPRGERGGVGRHRQLHSQETAAGPFHFLGWKFIQEPLEMKNLIKVWRRLKMKKHKIKKRRKANRYKNA